MLTSQFESELSRASTQDFSPVLSAFVSFFFSHVFE